MIIRRENKIRGKEEEGVNFLFYVPTYVAVVGHFTKKNSKNTKISTVKYILDQLMNKGTKEPSI